jgi:hypothetical protein
MRPLFQEAMFQAREWTENKVLSEWEAQINIQKGERQLLRQTMQDMHHEL